MSSTRSAYGRPSGRPRRVRLALAAFVACAGALAPAAAQAADPPVTVESVFASPIAPTEPRCDPEDAATILSHVAAEAKNTRASVSNDLCFGFTLPAGVSIDGDDMKKLAVTMPAGMAGSPDSIAKCTDAQFGAGNYADATCPDASMVGTVSAHIAAGVRFDSDPSSVLDAEPNLGGTAAPTWDGPNGRWDGLTDGGYLYNLAHGPNELARLGAVVQPVQGLAPAKFTVSLRLAADGSGRIETVVDNAPKVAYYSDSGWVNPDGTLTPDAVPSQLYVQSIGIRVWGDPAGRVLPAHTKNSTPVPAAPLMGGKEFIEWGTDCSTGGKASVSLTTYAGVASSGTSNATTLNGCNELGFTPSVSFATTETKPAAPTGLTVKVDLGQERTGTGDRKDRTALLKNASVTMPAGLEIGAQVASGDSGLPLCSEAAFAKDSLAANTCPPGAKVGDVKITTPLLSTPFLGGVYLGQQPAVGELPPLYIEASPEGSSGADAPRIKLVGSVKVDENGRLTTTFADNPQLRFSQLALTFPGGDHALFITPRTCDPVTGSSTFSSYAGQTVNVDASIQMTTDCGLPGFNPSIAMEPSNNTVGAKSPTKVTISREDRSPWLKDVKVNLPSGFLSDLTVVTECSKADAAAANCPESSRMGSVVSQAGAGAAPLSLGGSMYLVDRDEGAVAGAVIVVRAKIGELDLGNVVVPARIDLSPTDAVLTLSTSAPLRFKGLALNLRSIIVNLDRENFPLNPTSCGPLTTTASITGDNGQTATPSSSVSYAGCAALPFQPSFDAKLSGATKPGDHPQVDVTMVPRAGDSNLKSAKVVLPKGVSTDPDNLKNICPQANFLAGTCAEATKVGSVMAQVAITNDVISGGVYLVKRDGFILPGLGMAFSGRYTQRLLSTVKIDKDLRVVAEFGSIPDLPLRRLQMTIAGGAKGTIRLSPDACTTDSAWDATFGGQGGQTRNVSIPVPCATTKAKTTWSRKSGLKVTLAAPTGKTFKSAKLTLPKGFKLKSGKSRAKYAKLKLTGGKGKTKLTSTSLSTTRKGKGPRKVSFTISTKGYTLPKSYKGKLKKGKSIKLKIATVASDGQKSSQTLTVKVK